MSDPTTPLRVLVALGDQFERTLRDEQRATRACVGRRSRRLLAAASVWGVLAAGVALAAGSVLSGGREIRPDEAPAPGHPPAGLAETVIATGVVPVAGPWQITTYFSQEVRDGDDVVQPAGLPCLRILLRDPPRAGTPISGAGYCGEAGSGGFTVASVPASDGKGHIEVVLWGPAPAQATAVEVSAAGAKPLRSETQAGPPGFAGDVWVIAVPHTLRHAQVAWVGADGRRGNDPVDVSGDLERGFDLESLNRP